METLNTNMSARQPLHQPMVLLNEANLEVAEFAANKISIDSEKIRDDETARVIGIKLDQMDSAVLAAAKPQLAEPTAPVDPETMQQLLTDLRKIGDEPELATLFLLMSFVQKEISSKSEGVSPDLRTVLATFAAYASTVMPVVPPEIQKLFTELKTVENEKELANVLRTHVNAVLGNPVETPVETPVEKPIGVPIDGPVETPAKKHSISALLSLIFLLIDTQNLREEVEAELIGVAVVLALELADSIADDQVDAALFKLLGAVAGFGFSTAITGAASWMQLKGYRDGQVLVNMKSKERNYKREIHKLQRSLDKWPAEFTQLHKEKVAIETSYAAKSKQLRALQDRNNVIRTEIHHRNVGLKDGLGKKTGRLNTEQEDRLAALEINKPRGSRSYVEFEDDYYKAEKRKLPGNDSKGKGKEHSPYLHDGDMESRPDRYSVGRRIDELLDPKSKSKTPYQRSYDGSTDTLPRSDRLLIDKMDAEESTLKREIDSLLDRERALSVRLRDKQSDFDDFTQNEARYKQKLTSRETKIEALLEKIDAAEGSPEYYRNLGFAMTGMNNGSQVLVDGVGFMGGYKEADQTKGQAAKEAFSGIGQQREQERTSGIGSLRSSLMNLVESLHRSIVETLGYVNTTIKG